MTTITDTAARPRTGVVATAGQVDEAGSGLLGGRCTTCGRRAFPAPRQCPRCLGALAAYPLPRTGTLYSYSVVHVAGPPYVVGYVDLADDVRVFARVAAEEADLRPDLPVELRLERVGEQVSATWVPASARGGGVDA